MEERAGRRGGREEPFLRDGRVRRGEDNFWACLKKRSLKGARMKSKNTYP